MTFFPQDIKERLERSKLTELDLEEACCNYVYLQRGVDPRMLLREYYLMKGLCINDHNEDSDVNKPLWTDQMYHVMTFIEMTQALSGMKSTRAHRQIDEFLGVAAGEPSVIAPD